MLGQLHAVCVCQLDGVDCPQNRLSTVSALVDVQAPGILYSLAGGKTSSKFDLYAAPDTAVVCQSLLQRQGHCQPARASLVPLTTCWRRSKGVHLLLCYGPSDRHALAQSIPWCPVFETCKRYAYAMFLYLLYKCTKTTT